MTYGSNADWIMLRLPNCAAAGAVSAAPEAITVVRSRVPTVRENRMRFVTPMAFRASGRVWRSRAGGAAEGRRLRTGQTRTTPAYGDRPRRIFADRHAAVGR